MFFFHSGNKRSKPRINFQPENVFIHEESQGWEDRKAGGGENNLHHLSFTLSGKSCFNAGSH